MKKMITNIPFGPYVTVLAGAYVQGKPNYTTIGAYGVVSQKPVLVLYEKKWKASVRKPNPSTSYLYISINILILFKAIGSY